MTEEISINQFVMQAFEDAERPLNRNEMAARLNLPLAQVSTAINYLAGKHRIYPAPGEEDKKQNKRYVAKHHFGIAAPRMNSVLNAPAWVPPKPLHRPFIDVAPGVVVKRLLTGEVLQ